MPRTQSKHRNRAALIDAAIDEMAARGFQEARLEDIAARAGLTTGAVYSIFGSKRKLMDAAIALLAVEFAEELAPLHDPRLALVEVVRGYARTTFRAATRPQARERFAVELEYAIVSLREGGGADGALPGALDRLTRLLTGRTAPQLHDGHTTHAHAARLAAALAALVRGLTQEAVLLPGSVDAEYAADAAAALIGLLSTSD